MAKIKRLFNDPYDIVEEMVEGYVGAHKQYVKMCDLDEAQGRVVLANDAGTKDKVGVILRRNNIVCYENCLYSDMRRFRRCCCNR